MPSPAPRPVPRPDVYVHTQPFWTGARERKLLLQFCTDTGQFQHHPRPVSIHSGSRNLEWREVCGRGVIYACSILRVGRPDAAARLPLDIAIIELEEGVRIIANIIDSPADSIRIDAAVVLAWDLLDDDMPYPAFKVVG